ncbi:hypothetical protein COLO4_05664 [Corchorus olitorius]|uniref:Uncharacterized protein n=1 Tax=Corchorus olitorius TaxID=93759 RepID=A0A1R3KQB6_9ROSI|nr:hypothetical protein COLO4_05664 [Corchorus olitorius]
MPTSLPSLAADLFLFTSPPFRFNPLLQFYLLFQFKKMNKMEC